MKVSSEAVRAEPAAHADAAEVGEEEEDAVSVSPSA